MDALVRIWALIWMALVGWIASTVGIVLGVVFAIIDIPLQLLLGKPILLGTSSLGDWIGRLLTWNMDLLVYGLTGRGSFSWTP